MPPPPPGATVAPVIAPIEPPVTAKEAGCVEH